MEFLFNDGTGDFDPGGFFLFPLQSEVQAPRAAKGKEDGQENENGDGGGRRFENGV